MLEVKTEKGNECYVIMAGHKQKGIVGVAQCKYCTATIFLEGIRNDDELADFIIKFTDNHKCKATRPITKQILLDSIRKLHGRN